MIEQGWDPKTISERLGHDKPSFTRNRYVYVTQASNEEVASRLEAFAPTGTGGTIVPIREVAPAAMRGVAEIALQSGHYKRLDDCAEAFPPRERKCLETEEGS